MKWTREIVVTILIAILSLVISAYNGYNHNDKATEHRLSVVESNQQNDHENIKAIRDDVSWLVRAMGGK